jgi:hypothetical protein
MIVSGLERRSSHRRANGGDPFAQHVPPRIVVHERDGGAAIEFSEALAECDEGAIEVGNSTERVRERGK